MTCRLGRFSGPSARATTQTAIHYTIFNRLLSVPNCKPPMSVASRRPAAPERRFLPAPGPAGVIGRARRAANPAKRRLTFVLLHGVDGKLQSSRHFLVKSLPLCGESDSVLRRNSSARMGGNRSLLRRAHGRFECSGTPGGGRAGMRCNPVVGTSATRVEPAEAGDQPELQIALRVTSEDERATAIAVAAPGDVVSGLQANPMIGSSRQADVALARRKLKDLVQSVAEPTMTTISDCDGISCVQKNVPHHSRPGSKNPEKSVSQEKMVAFVSGPPSTVAQNDKKNFRSPPHGLDPVEIVSPYGGHKNAYAKPSPTAFESGKDADWKSNRSPMNSGIDSGRPSRNVKLSDRYISLPYS